MGKFGLLTQVKFWSGLLISPRRYFLPEEEEKEEEWAVKEREELFPYSEGQNVSVFLPWCFCHLRVLLNLFKCSSYIVLY